MDTLDSQAGSHHTGWVQVSSNEADPQELTTRWVPNSSDSCKVDNTTQYNISNVTVRRVVPANQQDSQSDSQTVSQSDSQIDYTNAVV